MARDTLYGLSGKHSFVQHKYTEVTDLVPTM